MKIRIIFVAAAVFVLCTAAAAWTHWRVSGEAAQKPDDDESKRAGTTGLVVLGDDKLPSLDIRVEPAGKHAMQDVHVVPGRIQYDETRHVDIRAAANGILVQVCAVPGDPVSRGQVLGVVSSPEIGLARTEVHHARENWQLASRKQSWVEETSKNVSELVERLKKRTPVDEIEKQFRGRTLGHARDTLLSAYARYLLAEHLANSAETIGRDVMPTATIESRLADRRSAEANLRAAYEQAGFDIQQQKQTAEIEIGDALRRLHIAEEQRTALLGYSPDTVPEDATAGEVLSRVEIRAPFPGTIEERHFAQSERVRTSDAIFVLADTQTLWVAADIREQDWLALAIPLGHELSVDAPALPGCKLTARVKRMGRRVVPETNAVPLVAEIGNANGLLRPGLFVNVSLPIGVPRDVLSIPAAAVVQHEGAKFVFVQEGPKTFRRADVTTGMQTDQAVEITKGLKEGAPVVVRGAIALKSELLIETLAKED